MNKKCITKSILKALDDKRYNTRTVGGIAKTVGVPLHLIVTMLTTIPELKQQIKIYQRRSDSGKILITTKKKFNEFASFRDKFIDIFITNRIVLRDEY